jgi:hypothetical protein
MAELRVEPYNAVLSTPMSNKAAEVEKYPSRTHSKTTLNAKSFYQISEEWKSSNNATDKPAR